MPITLYYSPGACSMAPHIALEETGAPFEGQVVRVSQKQNLTPEYLAIHPRGFVPVLDIGSARITEAAALLLHIGSRFPQAGLCPPPGSAEQARMFEWLCWLTNTLHVAYAGLWRPERFTDDPDARIAIVSEAKDRIDRMNSDIEERIGNFQYAAGDDYSLVDPFLLVFFRWANRIELDASGRRREWTAWARRVEQRAAVQRVLAREGVSLWE